MEHPEEILHSLEEFSKLKPKDIPRELEEYLCFVAKTGDPVYQWPVIKSLFREKLINVITEFYESCPSADIPICRNVDVFNCDSMKNFILEKLDTFAAAPFTVQRICELLTTPRKEYNRIDKYMRALEKNILVVSTTEPGNRRFQENRGVVNGLESEHAPEENVSSDINVEEMDDMVAWPTPEQNINETLAKSTRHSEMLGSEAQMPEVLQETPVATCTTSEQQPYVSIEPVTASESCSRTENEEPENVTITITSIPAGVQQRRNSIEPVVSSETVSMEPTESVTDDIPEADRQKTDSAEKKEEHQLTEEASADSTSESVSNEPVEQVPSVDNSVSNSTEQPEESLKAVSPEAQNTSPKPTEEEEKPEITDEITTTETEKLPEISTSCEEIPDNSSSDDSKDSVEAAVTTTAIVKEDTVISSSDETQERVTTSFEDAAPEEEEEKEVKEESEEIHVENVKGSVSLKESEVVQDENEEIPMEVDEKPEEPDIKPTEECVSNVE